MPTDGARVGQITGTKQAAFKAVVFRVGWPLVWPPATRACGCPVFQSSAGNSCVRKQELSVLAGKKTVTLIQTHISKTIHKYHFNKQICEWTWWTVKPLVSKPIIFICYWSTKDNMKTGISQVNKTRVLKQTLSFKKLGEPKLFTFIFLNGAEVMSRTTVYKNIPLWSKAVLIVWLQGGGTVSDRMTAVLSSLISYLHQAGVCVHWKCLMEVQRLRYYFSTTVQLVKLLVCQLFSKSGSVPFPSFSKLCPLVFLLWFECSWSKLLLE